jgi:asparagine synthase (glutamine-hydrolysing)
VCGIFGSINFPINVDNVFNNLRHRGPDDHGIYKEQSLIMGHLRLSINELSSLGAQPFESRNGRYILVYNGEIYNSALLIDQYFSSFLFKGTSDTELLIELISLLGIKEALSRIDAMFSVAILDRKEKKLHFARDRTGQKPLFYYFKNEKLVFASELTPLVLEVKSHTKLSFNNNAILDFLRAGYMPGTSTPIDKIYKAEPGLIYSFDVHKELRVKNLTTSRLLSFNPDKDEEKHKHKDLNLNDLKSQSIYFKEVFEDAVSRHLISDVPVGVALSGGIDSTLVAASIPKDKRTEITSFTVGFNETGFDESIIAKETSKALGMKYKKIILSPDDLLDRFTEIGNNFGEPVADLSVIPLTLLSEVASKDVKVLLTGDGGDELFHGYNRYLFWNKFGHIIQTYPMLTNTIAMALSKLESIKKNPGNSRIDNYLTKIQTAFNTRGVEDYYKTTVGLSEMPEPAWWYGAERNLDIDRVLQMARMDLADYLPNCVLAKTDRATMAASIEGRSPFLSAQVIEFASMCPSALKSSGGKGKIILREVLKESLPKVAQNFRKSGFSVPIALWLRGPLREWIWDTLLASRNVDFLEKLGLDPEKILVEHDTGLKDNSNDLWRLAVMLKWIESFYDIYDS